MIIAEWLLIASLGAGAISLGMLFTSVALEAFRKREYAEGIWVIFFGLFVVLGIASLVVPIFNPYYI